MSSNDTPDVRAARRAQREAERAARAQQKADAARQRAMDAARAGGLFDGMTTEPTPAQPRTEQTESEQTAASQAAYAGTGSSFTSRPARTQLDPDRRRKLTAALAAASVILVIVAGLATWGYIEARDATAAEQKIAVAPDAATDAAREITTQMFTYDHRTVDNDLAAVRERLAEPALGEFVEQSMPKVAEAAKSQEASVYATVAAAAPVEVEDAEHVKVLVMLNRMVSTKESPEAASSASRLNLSMVNVDGTWKLGKLESL